MAYAIDPGQLHAILVDVAADGQSLHLSATDTRTAGEDVQGNLGTAGVVSAAFGRFWGVRDDVGLRAAALVFRKAEYLSQTVVALIDADGRMTVDAKAAAGRIPTGYERSVAGRPGPQAE